MCAMPQKTATDLNAPSASEQSIIPAHVGFILDGNRRWAKARGLPTMEGHRQGAEAFRRTVKASFESGVKFVSTYVFSTENWSRTQDEVSYLMGLLASSVEKDLDGLHKEGIRVVVLGTRDKLDKKIDALLDKVEAKTANNTRATLAICFNYGGQLEVVDAVKSLINEGATANDITVEAISGHLYHPEVPPVDLIIRTSGEQRLSNFMLWRSTYAELLFIEKFWPDFDKADLDDALAIYAQRQRRYGK